MIGVHKVARRVKKDYSMRPVTNEEKLADDAMETLVELHLGEFTHGLAGVWVTSDFIHEGKELEPAMWFLCVSEILLRWPWNSILSDIFGFY